MQDKITKILTEISDDNAKNIISELVKELNLYNEAYYNKAESIISDSDFDDLLNCLKKLEEKYPEYILENSPTQKVGGFADEKFEKIKHNVTMLSLDNAFNEEDLIEFDNRIKKSLDQKYEYVCELKIDGIALSLRYEDNLKMAITRGDGLVGENVFHNVNNIKEVPNKINGEYEVRGEVYISKKEFDEIRKREEKDYANPRNLAAGTLRQLDSSTKNRKMNMFCYGLVDHEKLGHKTYLDSMEFLKFQGFPINEGLKKCASIQEVINFVKEIENKRNEYDYEIDGVVIKVNQYGVQKELGHNAKYPKWAMAYKFKAEEIETTLEDIFLTIGRTGKVTPNADLKTVHVMGSQVSRATLHNFNYIQSKDIRIGDSVYIIKAGDIIPRVERVNLEKRTNKIKKYIMPENCPACNSKLVLVEGDHYCKNLECPRRKIERLNHFVSKSGMDIDGLGERIIEKLVDNNLIDDVSDIYKLEYDQLIKIDRFEEKTVKNLLANIEKSKSRNAENFIFALGIEHVGIESAKIILKQYNNIMEFHKLTIDILVNINGIGNKTAESFESYFSKKENIALIQNFNDIGLNLKYNNYIVDEDNEFFGKVFVITGTFANYKRAEIKEEFEKLGSKNTTSISKNTDFLIVGENAGSKLKKAQDLDVEIINEEKMEEILGVR